MDTEIQALPENVDDLQRLLRELIGTTDSLRSDVAAREDALAQTLRELATERKENDRLREQIRLYLQKQFGPSSEKLSKDQLKIFNESELLSEPEEEETSPDGSTMDDSGPSDPGRPRRKKGRRPLPPSLPRRDVIHDLEPDEKICPHDGHELQRIGEEVSEQLEFVPSKVEVILNIRLNPNVAEERG